ncbi:UDP-2,3-diacylglucosamine diphosphatase LpxI [Ferrimonas balearica]|nr:UDP-2,3-diacylglucosamine diphosphatase LpxI [Ferrimonas balearica]
MTTEAPRGRLAIIAGAGALPVALAEAEPKAFLVSLAGIACDLPEERLTRYRFEKLGSLFRGLKDAGVTRVVLAGSLARPDFDKTALDAKMLMLAPRLLKAMGQGGDDSLLRLVISIFEEEGFAVQGAHEVLPDLIAPTPGLLAGPAPDAQLRADATRGAEILAHMAPLDIGQACVVAGGLCLGIETLQGSDALLRYVATTPAHLRRAPGVFVKRPKAGQDLRVDMPAIGPATVEGAHAAGLAAIAIAPGGVLLLDRAALLARAEDLGVTIWVQEA